MRVEGLIFAVMAVFFAVVATSYGVLSRDPVGTTALSLCGGVALLVGLYALVSAHRTGPIALTRPPVSHATGILAVDRDSSRIAGATPTALGF